MLPFLKSLVKNFPSCSLLFTAKCRKADELFRKGEGPGSVADNLDNMAVVATAAAVDASQDVADAVVASER